MSPVSVIKEGGGVGSTMCHKRFAMNMSQMTWHSDRQVTQIQCPPPGK